MGKKEMRRKGEAEMEGKIEKEEKGSSRKKRRRKKTMVTRVLHGLP